MALKYGVRNAFDIFYRANTVEWNRFTGFLEAAVAVLNTIEYLNMGFYYPFNYNLDIKVAVDAFQEVGIQCVRDASAMDDAEDVDGPSNWIATKIARH